jgi:hypothetical protein
MRSHRERAGRDRDGEMYRAPGGVAGAPADRAGQITAEPADS